MTKILISRRGWSTLQNENRLIRLPVWNFSLECDDMNDNNSFFLILALGARDLNDEYSMTTGNKRHTMSHTPESIIEMESPIKRRKPESKLSLSSLRTKKSKVIYPAR